ncbi:MAG TPA: hypothetical protein VNX15_07220 [Gemmatimonadales bacterium]|nr:hypothetical protein [Gemmatimonadales bacterium]
MRQRFLPMFLLAGLALVGCQRRGQVSPQIVAKSLKGVLVYPRSVLVSMASGDSAGQLTLSSQDAPDSVASWFRNSLALNNWTLQSDARQTDGSILIYAERGTQPLWISIQDVAGARGTSYTVTGAIAGSADSTARGDSTQRSGSSMSSKRIHRR